MQVGTARAGLRLPVSQCALRRPSRFRGRPSPSQQVSPLRGAGAVRPPTCVSLETPVSDGCGEARHVPHHYRAEWPARRLSQDPRMCSRIAAAAASASRSASRS